MRLNLAETLLTVWTRKVCGRPKWPRAACRTIRSTSSSGSESNEAAAAAVAGGGDGGGGDIQYATRFIQPQTS